MCPSTFSFYCFLLAAVLFVVYVNGRYRAGALDSLENFAGLIDSPTWKKYYFGFRTEVTGFYCGRKTGWDFYALQENNRCMTLYAEPKREFKRKLIIFSPTSSVIKKTLFVFNRLRNFKGQSLHYICNGLWSIRNFNLQPL